MRPGRGPAWVQSGNKVSYSDSVSVVDIIVLLDC